MIFSLVFLEQIEAQEADYDTQVGYTQPYNDEQMRNEIPVQNGNQSPVDNCCSQPHRDQPVCLFDQILTDLLIFILYQDINS